MAILEREVLIGLAGRSARYYEDLGYVIPKRKDIQGRMKPAKGTSILVKVEHLPETSSVEVTKICDDCGVKKKTKYLYVSTARKNDSFKDGKDRCHKCSRAKTGELFVKRHSVNCAYNVDKEFSLLFWNEEDARVYTCKSNRKVDFKCPNCSLKIEEKKIADIYRQGLSCPRCSDGVSYPEKFVGNALSQLDVDFHTQKRFDWAEGKIYDIYIESMNTIIEINGVQHYEDSKWARSFEVEKSNDKEKMNLAIENGMNYIVIDARVSEIDYLEESIKDSSLSQLVNLKQVSWIDCHMNSCKSLVSESWKLWNGGVRSTREIGKILNLSTQTARRYLVRGQKAGVCSYSPKEGRKEAGNRRIGLRGTPVVQLSIEDNKFICKHDSIRVASEKIGLPARSTEANISATCRGRQKTAYGYRWMYLQDYESQLASS